MSQSNLATAENPSAAKYANYFDHVAVINLDRRPDRLKSFYNNLDNNGWIFKRPIRVRAVDGDKVQCSPTFTQGNGAYGCRASWLTVLQDFMMDYPHGAKLLCLEDDAYLKENSVSELCQFLDNLPSDFDCGMLGGQHIGSTRPVNSHVVKCTNTQRTHAMLLTGDYVRTLYHLFSNAKVHIDWEMAKVQAAHNVYAPAPNFIFGQEAGSSDISGQHNPRKVWSGNPNNANEMVLLHAPKKVMAELRASAGWHGGNWRDAITDLDNGLRTIFDSGAEPDIEQLTEWIRVVGREIDADGVLVLHHPLATLDIVQQATNRKVKYIKATTAEDALRQYQEGS
jgi:hypothetical protein